MIERREAIALSLGLALSSVAAQRAGALARPIPRFVPGRHDLERMTAKLEVLRHHWNRATLSEFFAEHCTEDVEVSFYIGRGSDRRGGTWSSPDDIRFFQLEYPRISSGYSGVMSPPDDSTIYTIAEFERTPPPPPGPDDAIFPVGPDRYVAIALQLTFEQEQEGRTARLASGKRIITGLSLREVGYLDRFFTHEEVCDPCKQAVEEP